MLAISPAKNEIESQMEKSMLQNDHSQSISVLDFPDFSAGIDLLDTIDFDDLFVNGDLLPDFEIDLPEFSVTGGEDSVIFDVQRVPSDEVASKTDVSSSLKEGDEKRKKSLNTTKNPNGKRKVKVDWTPELHRRFVQAVEHLGVDKAVPSRILELMGIDCLTRHNIASHLQKYRSHRKHLLAREAEAASWSQRRQMYTGGGGPAKRADHVTMGFPPVTVPMTHFRPLHVWGHPSVDQSVMPTWHKPPTTSPPVNNSYWNIPLHRHVPTPGIPCFPPHPPPTRFPTPEMYKQGPSDLHPSKESVDAAIGDVLSKPWLPLPLGLKPPSVDGVMVELQRQGIPKIPLTCA